MLLTVAGLLWLGAAVGGLELATAYEALPGASAAAPRTWPSASRIPRSPVRTSVILFLHPLCPCSRATLREMQRIAARGADRIAVTVVLVGAPDEPTFAGTDEATVRRLLPDARVVVGEAEARTFGVRTSGQVVAYDDTGRLVFEGGITASRGHEGPSRGGDDLLRVAAGDAPLRGVARVFGCALEGPRARRARED